MQMISLRMHHVLQRDGSSPSDREHVSSSAGKVCSLLNAARFHAAGGSLAGIVSTRLRESSHIVLRICTRL